MSKTQAQSPNNILEIKDLSCAWGEKTLFTNLSFSLKAQECLHIKGENGSGKTSLLRMIAGFSQANGGQINWQKENDLREKGFVRSLSYLGHLDGLKNELSAAENLSVYQTLYEIHDERVVDRDLMKMGLLSCADLAANQLSFGQRRRLAFARLLTANSQLWILDEPFTGIDASGRHLIESICLDHLKSGGAILLTNHQDLDATVLAPHLNSIYLSEQQHAQ